MKTFLCAVSMCLTCPAAGLAEGDVPQHYRAQILHDLGVTTSKGRKLVTFYKPAEARIEAKDGKTIRTKAVLVHFTPLDEKGRMPLLIASAVYVWIGSNEVPTRLSTKQTKWVEGEPKSD
jgi:hypothetical protein